MNHLRSLWKRVPNEEHASRNSPVDMGKKQKKGDFRNVDSIISRLLEGLDTSYP